MNGRLLLVVCSSFAPEVQYIVETENYPAVAVRKFGANCVALPSRLNAYAALANSSEEHFSQTVFIGSSCIAGNALKQMQAPGTNFRIVHLQQCFELFLNARTVESLVLGGAYLVSNGWLQDLPAHIRNWDFDPDTAKRFFAESARKIVLLDTGLPGDIQPQLKELSDYTGLPWEVLPVGLDTCTLRIDALVKEWRDEHTHREMVHRLSEVSSRSAGYEMAFEQMKQLVDSVEETEVISHLYSVLTMLFAPKDIVYEAVIPLLSGKEDAESFTTRNDPMRTDSELTIFLTHHEELLGIMHVREITFPQYISRYKDIARLIGRIGGLALANARKFQTINEDEQQLRIIAEELRSVIATKDLFFNIIAHDLRSPLQGLLGLTALMADGSYDLQNSEEFASLGDDLYSSALQLHMLMENLLQWAQSQRGSLDLHMQDINLQQIISQSIQPLLGTAAQKNITIEVLVDHLQTLFTDKRLIETVLRNLVTNAIKFTQNGGNVSISAESTESDDVLIVVRDSGIGMSPAILEKLFRIETKVHRLGTEGESGTGLGLVLCKEFTEQLGGRIDVRSEEGIGTVFSITMKTRPHECIAGTPK
ncbi:MAG: ATP-binding protein [Bacteroidota bacterium]|jgi:signal transduction histidine kinase